MMGLLRNIFSAIIKGNLLLRLNVDRFFIHILYVFFLAWLLILCNLLTENTLDKVEKNKAILHEKEIIWSDRTFAVAAASRRSAVEQKLREMGSSVQEPEENAIVLMK